MKIKQNTMDVTMSGSGALKNSLWRIYLIFLISLIFLIIPMGTLSCDEEDPIYKKCMAQKDDPGPWCYMEEVKKNGDASLCENITKYWPKATGVRAQCYYELARKKMDCELCKKIRDKDIKKMCELDVCR